MTTGGRLSQENRVRVRLVIVLAAALSTLPVLAFAQTRVAKPAVVLVTPPARAKSAPSKSKAAGKKPASPWRVPSYAKSSEGDVADGDDPAVRRAALGALGPLNG